MLEGLLKGAIALKICFCSTPRGTINNGPRAQRPKDEGPEDLASCVALCFYDSLTCVNVLSSNVHLYHCESQSPHSKDVLHTKLCHFTLSLLPLSFLHSKSSLLYSPMQLTSYDVHAIQSTMLQP